MAFKKEMAEEEARYKAACEARDAAWKKEAAKLWGRARRRAEEVYEDGYFARKVIGVGRLIAAWRWADKLQRATNEEFWWAPNEMARSPHVSASKRQIGTSSAARQRSRSTASAMGRRRALGSCWRGAAGILAPGGIISFSIVRFQFYALYLVVVSSRICDDIIYIYSMMN